VNKVVGLFSILICLVFSSSLQAWAQEAEDVDFAAWDTFLEGVRAEALQNGISPEIVAAATQDLKPRRKFITQDRKQAEFKQTFENYIKRRVSEARINNGRKMMAKHAEVLARITAEYDVQARYIVAIWGMETNYGLYPIKDDAIQALATMAFDKRRQAFFRKELMAAFQILDEGHIDLENMKGSWAGALGQSQFMPTSFLGYARDGNGDGRRDIWTTEADVFASIANYLAEHGWRGDHQWGREVVIPDGMEEKLVELGTSPPNGCRAFKSHTQRLSLTEWNDLGVRHPSGDTLEVKEMQASLVRPDGEEGPAFLAYANYQPILSYNCANLYALSVGHLAEEIK
jgi:membrane-bound lytic murein transglycosylase B